jgi:hypothetical protein
MGREQPRSGEAHGEMAVVQARGQCLDGVHVKAGLDKDKAALLVAIAGCADGRKELVALVAGHRESEAAWSVATPRRPCCAIFEHTGLVAPSSSWAMGT